MDSSTHPTVCVSRHLHSQDAHVTLVSLHLCHFASYRMHVCHEPWAHDNMPKSVRPRICKLGSIRIVSLSAQVQVCKSSPFGPYNQQMGDDLCAVCEQAFQLLLFCFSLFFAVCEWQAANYVSVILYLICVFKTSYK